MLRPSGWVAGTKFYSGTDPEPGPAHARRMKARLALALAAASAVVAALAWTLTPSVSDLQARTGAFVTSHQGVELRPDQVPRLLAEAVVATEDERFYQHHGLDLVGVARALIFDVAHACACEGGSTITQQLVKTIYLSGSDRGLAKLEDLVLALKAETVLSKQQILADYLSTIPTGPMLYGVAPAACVYFGWPLSRLRLGGLALLAGLTQAPSIYDPFLHPSAAARRRREVLAAMVSDGYITSSAAAVAAQEPISARSAARPGCGV